MPLGDSSTDNILAVLDECCGFIDQSALSPRAGLLVHAQQVSPEPICCGMMYVRAAGSTLMMSLGSVAKCGGICCVLDARRRWQTCRWHVMGTPKRPKRAALIFYGQLKASSDIRFLNINAYRVITDAGSDDLQRPAILWLIRE